jgi:hypothetical protein
MADEFTTTRTQTVSDQGGPDVAAMSDVAKRKRRQDSLQAAATPNLAMATGEGDIPDAGLIRAAEMDNPRALQLRIANLRVEQQTAQRVGNMDAVQTYADVIDALQQRIAKLQTPASQPATQPVGVR